MTLRFIPRSLRADSNYNPAASFMAMIEVAGQIAPEESTGCSLIPECQICRINHSRRQKSVVLDLTPAFTGRIWGFYTASFGVIRDMQ